MIILFDIVKTWWDLLIGLAAGIYKLVGYCYQIFLALAKINIFGQDDYLFLVNKIYIILGVLVLFIFAYNFLTFIVDPDKNKSGAEVEKMIKKILISFILILLCPTLFNFAFKVQDAILDQNIFANFFSSTSTDDINESVKTGGYRMAAAAFNAFFSPETGYTDETIESTDQCTPYENNRCSLSDAKKWVEVGHTPDGTDTLIAGGKFRVFTAFASEIKEKKIDFSFLMSLISGGFLVYVILSFCFDLALRVIKLAFYQIIAPICIACQVIPNKESIYSNWWKAVSKTYISIFVRVFIMNFGVFLLDILATRGEKIKDSFASVGDNGTGIRAFAYALLIMGVVTFIKQASKLIDEIFGLGDVKLGIKDKMAAGGAFAAGSLVGAGVTSLARNAVHASGNIKKAWKENTGKDRLREVSHAAAKGLGSVVAGGVSGAYRGGKAGWKAASGADMKKAASAAAKETVEKRDEREAYRATHDLGKLHGTTPIIGGIATTAGRVVDAWGSVRRWAGSDNIAELQADNESIQALTNDVSSVIDQCKKILMDKAMAGKKWKLGINPQQAKDYSESLGLAAGSVGSLEFSDETLKLLQSKIAEAESTGKSVVVEGLSLDLDIDDVNELGQVKVKSADGTISYKDKSAVLSTDVIQKKKREFSAKELEKVKKDFTNDFDRTKKDYSSIIGLQKGSLGYLEFSLENVKMLQEKINESKRTGESVEVAGLSDAIVEDVNELGQVLVKSSDGSVSYKDRDKLSSDDVIQKKRSGMKLSAEQLESIMGKYMSDYSKILADVAFKGDTNFNNTFIDEKTKTRLVSEDEWNVVSSLHASAQKARVNIEASAGSETIKAANAEAIRTQAIKLIQDAIKPGGSGKVGEITLDASDFDYDSKSGAIISMSDKGREALEQLSKSQTVIESAHILTTESLRGGNTDIVVSGDGAADKISAAGGSIINENNRRINQIRSKNNGNANGGSNK